MSKQYLTISQAAELIGVTELTLRNWDKTGKFAASRHPINNYRIYTLEQVGVLMKKMGQPKPTKKLIVKVLED
ncbi:MerR family DNA-binding transcriptional regulator [Candidatus Giovannonibacteria bacterium]|nr:MerR family DNA-binding transcriptional regulator [Candidatus Giovannonibacteria bacterium]